YPHFNVIRDGRSDHGTVATHLGRRDTVILELSLVGFLSPLERKFDTYPRGSDAWVGLRRGRSTPSLQTNLAGRKQKLANPLRVQPGSATSRTQKLPQTPQTATPNQADQAGTVLHQCVQQMRDLHQKVVAAHGLPVVGKVVFVLIALMLLHQDPFLDRPTMPCP